MSRAKESNELARELSSKGWTVTKGKCHWKALAPDKVSIVVFAVTPSDHRALKNIRAIVRRVERTSQQ